MASIAAFVIEKLSRDHDLSRFDCGSDALNLWLKRFAWTNVQNDSARVYVAHCRDGVVVGYHALSAGSISRAEAPERIGHGLAAHPIGVVVLGRLAAPSPVDEMRLMLLMKDLRAFLRTKKL